MEKTMEQSAGTKKGRRISIVEIVVVIGILVVLAATVLTLTTNYLNGSGG